MEPKTRRSLAALPQHRARGGRLADARATRHGQSVGDPSLVPTGKPSLVAVIPAGWVVKTADTKPFTVAVPTYLFGQATATFISGADQTREQIALVLCDRRPESLSNGKDSIQLGMPPSGATVTPAGLRDWATAFNRIDDPKWAEIGNGTPFEVAAGPGLIYQRIVPKAEAPGLATDLYGYTVIIATKRGVFVVYDVGGVAGQAAAQVLLQSILNSLVMR